MDGPASPPPPPPPPYSRTAAPPPRPIPEITILLLGSPGVGKSTFISALPRVRDGRLQPVPTGTDDPHLPASIAHASVPNPTTFSVSLYNRPYRIVIHRSESTLFVDPFPDRVDLAVLAYAVDSRESLYNAQHYWRKQFAERYERDRGLTVPVMLVGFKRDLRTDERRAVAEHAVNVVDLGGNEWTADGEEVTVKEGYVCVMPNEGMQAASQMRCDRYAECSALTGELMWEVLEDLTRTAALTTTSKGGLSEGGCVAM